MRDYSDIIDLPHHTSDRYPRMSAHDRAAQFAPFAALSGYDDAIDETARLTDERQSLTDEITNTLNMKLGRLRECIANAPEIRVTHFIADSRKNGGRYVCTTGRAKKLDGFERLLYMQDGQKICLDEIIDIEVI